MITRYGLTEDQITECVRAACSVVGELPDVVPEYHAAWHVIGHRAEHRAAYGWPADDPDRRDSVDRLGLAREVMIRVARWRGALAQIETMARKLRAEEVTP